MTLTAPARPTTHRAARRPAPAPRRRPRIVEQAPRSAGRKMVERLARVPFLVTCGVLLVVGLLAVLVLNMTIAQTSYTLSDLQEKARTYDDQALALQHDLDQVSSSAHLAQQAAALGMGPVTAPMFLDPQTGTISGVAEKARRDENFTVVTGREAAAPVVAPTRAAADPSVRVAGLGLGGGLAGALSSLGSR